MIERILPCPRCGALPTAIVQDGDSVRVEFWACRHDMRVQIPPRMGIVRAVNAVIRRRAA